MRRRKSSGPDLRRALSERRLAGPFVKLPSTDALEAVGEGFDFVIVDLEHSQLSEAEALGLARHGSAVELPVVVRVPAVDAGLINRLLEAGASGIQLSSVTGVEQVRALVRATRFAPDGRRSVSPAHGLAGFGSVPLEEAVAFGPPLLVGQIETEATDDPLQDILLAGLDVAFLGTTDLLVDVGFDRERVAARVAEVTAAAATAGVALGAFATTASAVPPEARYVALSSDLAILRSGASALRAELEGV